MDRICNKPNRKSLNLILSYHVNPVKKTESDIVELKFVAKLTNYVTGKKQIVPIENLKVRNEKFMRVFKTFI